MASISSGSTTALQTLRLLRTFVLIGRHPQGSHRHGHCGMQEIQRGYGALAVRRLVENAGLRNPQMRYHLSKMRTLAEVTGSKTGSSPRFGGRGSLGRARPGPSGTVVHV